jgi:hypothetical protein
VLRRARDRHSPPRFLHVIRYVRPPRDFAHGLRTGARNAHAVLRKWVRLRAPRVLSAAGRQSADSRCRAPSCPSISQSESSPSGFRAGTPAAPIAAAKICIHLVRICLPPVSSIVAASLRHPWMKKKASRSACMEWFHTPALRDAVVPPAISPRKHRWARASGLRRPTFHAAKNAPSNSEQGNPGAPVQVQPSSQCAVPCF